MSLWITKLVWKSLAKVLALASMVRIETVETVGTGFISPRFCGKKAASSWDSCDSWDRVHFTQTLLEEAGEAVVTLVTLAASTICLALISPLSNESRR